LVIDLKAYVVALMRKVMNKVINWLAGAMILMPMWSFSDIQENDFTDIKFDDLMQIEVTSVSKKSEKLSEASAAIYVITSEEIRRVGATSIPDALRLVPGVDVAKIDANKWAVSIRGFNSRFANKLLVMIDGRTVYTPTSSGVYWENLNYLIADINRIEVIRGPGATLWGANAVNGVINIITVEASEKQGGAASLAIGNEYQEATVRQGGGVSENAQLRAYVTSKRLDESKGLSGNNQDNQGEYLQTGLRLDIQASNNQWLTFQGDLYKNDLRQEYSLANFAYPYISEAMNSDVETHGGNISAQWGILTNIDSEFNINISYDFYDNNDLQFNEHRDTFNIELTHNFTPFSDHELVMGSGYRWNKSEIEDSPYFSMSSSNENSYIWNLFIQDTINFPEQNMALTLGSKLEGGSYNSTELQPNIRLSWLASQNLTWWGAISRSIRTPSLVEKDAIINIQVIPSYPYDETATASLIQIVGNDDFQSEELEAYELGLRWMVSSEISLDVATFYNKYENLRSYDLGEAEVKSVNGNIFYVIPINLDNNLKGYSYGAELLATWQMTPEARFRFSYSFLDIKLEDTQSNIYSNDLISLVADRSIEHQASIWGSFDLTESIELDTRLYYTAERNWDSITDNQAISGYFDSDLRIGWQATKSLTLSLVGRHLLHSQQREFITESWKTDSLIERSLFINGSFTW
jgi:iron complex outermembrane receptor protein